ncbi:MAG: EAL domain-containing protein [Burkholderiales bacterium]
MRLTFARIIRRSWLPWAVLAAGLLMSFVAFQLFRIGVAHESRLKFEAEVSNISKAIESQIWSYHDVLYGVRGLFEALPTTSRASFRNYFLSLNLKQRYPGFQVLAFIRHVPLDQRHAFEERVRHDASIDPRGYPDFHIRPDGDRPEYYVLEYIEPAEQTESVLGFDTASDATRIPALERARDSGQLVASGRLVLSNATARNQTGFSLRLPVYRRGLSRHTEEQRRQAFVGLVSATFTMKELVASVLSRQSLQNVRIRIFDTGLSGAPHAKQADEKSSLLFDSTVITDGATVRNGLPLPGATALSRKTTLDIGGRQWEVHFTGLGGRADLVDQLLPLIVLAGGIVTSLLLFALIRTLASSHDKAVSLANRMTEDLRESRQRFRDLAQLSSDWFWEQDAEFRFTAMSGGLAGKAGLDSAATLGKRRWDLPIVGISEQQWDAHRRMLERHLPFRDFEYQIDIDGTRHWFSVNGNPVFGADGKFRGYRGTGKDITERKQDEKRLLLEHNVTALLTAAEDTEQAILDVIRIFCETLDWTYGAYWTWDSHGNCLVRRQCHGALPAQGEAGSETVTEKTIAESDGLLGRVWSHREPVWIADIANDSSFRRHAVAASQGFRCALAFPVMIGNTVAGIMEFFCPDVRKPDESSLRLGQAVGGQLGQFIARRGAEQDLQFVATHDPLTSLPNRSTFNQRLDHALSQAQRHQRKLAVMFADLDRFKNINDTLGHDAGDHLLRELAIRLRRCLRNNDTVCRQGGDEFVVLIEEYSDIRELSGIAQKILDTVAKPFIYQEREYLLTASIGISTYPNDAADVQSLLKNADIAMYRAKEQGKNNYQFYSEQMNMHTVERLSLESALRRALERNEFLLHYQPKLDIRSRRITGVEALVRWQHQDFGLVAPEKFIPLAEETGLIVPIGEWVLHNAAAAARAWRKLGFPARVAVNLSARQFSKQGLLTDIIRALGDNLLGADALELEITESMVMREPERSTVILEQLKAEGMRLAIDDFGTGYSSLGYLKRFPIDCLKIDRSFIADIPADADDAAITHAIIAMAHSLELQVVAEGVETAAQFAFLERHQCDEMQGHHFSAPLPENELVALMRRHTTGIAA